MSSLNLLPMYDGLDGSPITTLLSEYNTADTSMSVRDVSVLPCAPNVCTLYSSSGTYAAIAVVTYQKVEGNVLSDLCVIYKNTEDDVTFPRGTFVSRKYTEYDQRAFKQNIETLGNVVKGILDILHPTAYIGYFVVRGLPSCVPYGSHFQGTQEIEHREQHHTLIHDLVLQQDGIVCAEIIPAENKTIQRFEADLTFDEFRAYTYTLCGNDVSGNVLSKEYTTKVVHSLYVGHTAEPVLTEATLNTFKVGDVEVQYSNIEFIANDDYVWLCVAKPFVIKKMVAGMFDVPYDDAIIRERNVGTDTVACRCYRIHEKLVGGMTHTVKVEVGEEW